ncbi:MAG TPA: glycosyltransferase family 87 protein [Terriglobales bacterium]|nr:glycosyltransferase family 87 protein [Terriglobales bacterium]
MSAATALAPSLKLRSVEGTIAWFAAGILLIGAVLWADHPPAIEMTDFSVTYIGARMVYEGRGAKLYDLAEQQSTKAALFTHAQPLIFEHPPFEALLLAPLGRLDYKTAYLIWGLLNVAVWLYLPYLLRPYAPSPRSDLAYLALWMSFPPLGIALYQGQSSLLLLLVFALAFICLKRGKEFRAGLWLGLGLFKFQFVLPLILIFLLRRKWKVFGGFAVAATALAVLSFVAAGLAGIMDYVRLMLNVAGHAHNFSYGKATDMATLQAFSNTVLGSFLSAPVIHFIVAVASAIMIVLAARQFQNGTPGAWFDRFFAVSIVVSLATGIHMFAHDISPLALSAFLVLPYLAASSARGWSLVIRVCIVLFWLPPLYFVAIARHELYLLFPLIAVLATAIAQIRLSHRPVLVRNVP